VVCGRITGITLGIIDKPGKSRGGDRNLRKRVNYKQEWGGGSPSWTKRAGEAPIRQSQSIVVPLRERVVVSRGGPNSVWERGKELRIGSSELWLVGVAKKKGVNLVWGAV